MIDWYDKNQCHRRTRRAPEVRVAHLPRLARQHDRPVTVDLQKLSDAELVALQLHENEWYCDTRAASCRSAAPTGVHAALKRMLNENPE